MHHEVPFPVLCVTLPNRQTAEDRNSVFFDHMTVLLQTFIHVWRKAFRDLLANA